MSNSRSESPKPSPIVLTSNFHAGQIDAKSNFHTGQSNFHSGENFHAGESFHASNPRTGEESGKGLNFHAGNFHVGQLNSHPMENFHAGQIDASGNFHVGQSNFHAGNFHAGNFHAGGKTERDNFHAGNFHAGNFHAGDITTDLNFHAGAKLHDGNFHAGGKAKGDNFHAGNFHAGNFHAGGKTEGDNFHAGNFHAGDGNLNFHAGNFHAGDRTTDLNFHAGDMTTGLNFHAGGKTGGDNFHAGNFHAGGKVKGDNFHAGNFHAGDNIQGDNFHAGNFHAGDASKAPNKHEDLDAKQNFHIGFSKPLSQAEYDVSDIINFHAGQPSGLAAGRRDRRPLPSTQLKDFETSLSFYASTFDGKPGFNHVEKPADGIYSNVTTSSHQLLVTDIRGSEDQLDLDRDAVLAVSNIPDHGHTFTDDADVIKKFYPEVEQLLLEHVPGAQRIFIFDHTIRRKFGDRGPVLRAHIDQTPASALARVTRHLPDEAATLAKGRVRLINFWRPINGTVENYPLAFALSGSVPDTKLEAVKHHYPTWTGETYGVGYSEGQNWCYWSKMGNSDALLLQCFDNEKGGRLAHSAVLDPTSTSQKYRESIEVRALVFG